MNKVIKIILITLLSIVAIIFLIGAYYLATYEVPAPVDTSAIVKEKALTYLKERYSEEFEITGCGEYVNSNNYIIYAYVKGVPKNDDYKVTIRGWLSKEKGEITFRDNYVAVKLKPELKEYIKKSLETECPDCIIEINYPNNCLENNVDEYKNIEEFLTKDTHWKPYIDVEIIMYKEKIRKKSLIKKCNSILSILVDKNISGSTTLYFITNQDKYNKIIHESDVDLGILGKDYVYTHCILKKTKNLI